MLYWLATWAGEYLPALNVLKAVTFRAAFAALFAFVLCVTLGPHFIRHLRRKKIEEDVGQKDSAFLAEKHSSKKHTPTMGGVILMGSTLLGIVCFARFDILFTLLACFVLCTLALLGFYDDYMKLTQKRQGGHKGRNGLTVREKLVFQFTIGLGVGLILTWYGEPVLSTQLAIPFVDAAVWPVLGYFYIGWAAIVVVGASNAVNLTDGLDGLATLCTITVAVAFGLLAYFAGHAGIAEHLAVPRVHGAEELSVVCAALAGACLGFLWFNAHPADIFMGDTGSLPMGGLVGLVALSIKQELLLILIGGVFVVEALSVLIQIVSFRYWKRRVFLIAPLHHHFEKLGWSESKIVSRFFIVSVLLAVFSIAMLRVK